MPVKYICSAADYKSTSKKRQGLQNKEVTENTETDLALDLVEIVKKHPDLAEIVAVWPDLPEHIKAAIKALAQTYNIEGK